MIPIHQVAENIESLENKYPELFPDIDLEEFSKGNLDKFFKKKSDFEENFILGICSNFESFLQSIQSFNPKMPEKKNFVLDIQNFIEIFLQSIEQGNYFKENSHVEKMMNETKNPSRFLELKKKILKIGKNLKKSKKEKKFENDFDRKLEKFDDDLKAEVFNGIWSIEKNGSTKILSKVVKLLIERKGILKENSISFSRMFPDERKKSDS